MILCYAKNICIILAVQNADVNQIQDFLHGRITAFHETQISSENFTKIENFSFHETESLLSFSLKDIQPEDSLTAYLSFVQAEHSYQGTLSMYISEISLKGIQNGQTANWKIPPLPDGVYELRIYNGQYFRSDFAETGNQISGND